MYVEPYVCLELPSAALLLPQASGALVASGTATAFVVMAAVVIHRKRKHSQHTRLSNEGSCGDGQDATQESEASKHDKDDERAALTSSV